MIFRHFYIVILKILKTDFKIFQMIDFLLMLFFFDYICRKIFLQLSSAFKELYSCSLL